MIFTLTISSRIEEVTNFYDAFTKDNSAKKWQTNSKKRKNPIASLTIVLLILESSHIDEVVDDVLVMVLAGTDSTANTLGFLLREMCHHKPYQDR